MIGNSLSHYQITAELGRGGMGIVYRATDTKLNRDVALKILPAAALASKDDRARFFREAQSAAQLHHPNIATVFEIDEAVLMDGEGNSINETDGPRPYIVMELIDGETLQEVIKKAPLSLADAVKVSSQVAEALKAAHAKNIVHRDIKSANVMMTEDGIAKVLDFGLAKTNQSTMLTRMGSTLGTVAYMSPEQARGEEVDHRTDIWALGCVLYEMVIGQHPFGGDYEQAVVYSILNEAPQPPTSLRTGVPLSLDWIIGKCLAKSADERYQSMQELQVDLRNVDLSAAGFSRVSTASAASIPVASAFSTASRPSMITAGVAIATLVLGVAMGWLFFGGQQQVGEEAQTVGFVYDRLPGLAVTNLNQRAVSISDDGLYVVVSSSGDMYSGRTDNFAKAGLLYDEFNSRPHTPSVEPGGTRVSFIDGTLSKLLVTERSGSVPIPLDGQMRGTTGTSWARDGYVYTAAGNNGMYRTPISGQPQEKVDVPNLVSDTYLATPYLLPGGKWLLYARGERATGWNNASLMALNMETGEERTLVRGATDPKFVEPDILVFSQSGTISAGRINPDEPREIVGPLQVLNESVWALQAVAQYDLSNTGHLIYVSNEGTESGWKLALHSIDGSGSIDTLDVMQKMYYSPTISPDGRSIAVDYLNASTGDRELEIIDVQSGRVTPIYTKNDVWTPVWSPDGEYVVFSAISDSSSQGHLTMRPVDLSEEARVLLDTGNWTGPDDWSPDGKKIMVNELKTPTSGGRDLILYDVETGETQPFAVTSADEEDGRFSPDGQWVVYSSDETGEQEIWLSSSTPGGSKYLVSNGGGLKARWAKDGNSIVYINRDRLFEVDITFTPRPQMGLPRLVVEGHYYFHYNTGAMGEYDTMPDGRLLLFDRDTYRSLAGEVRVILHWGQVVDQMLPPLD